MTLSQKLHCPGFGYSQETQQLPNWALPQEHAASRMSAAEAQTKHRELRVAARLQDQPPPQPRPTEGVTEEEPHSQRQLEMPWRERPSLTIPDWLMPRWDLSPQRRQ